MGSFVDDDQRLMPFYLEVLSNLRFAVDKIWASARFFATLVSALVSVSVGTAVVLAKADDWIVSRNWIGAVATLIPLLLIAISLIGFLNLKREYSRYLEIVVVAAKLQEQLGLYEPIESTVFPQDSSLLPARYSLRSFPSSEAFISFELQSRGNLYWYLKLLHGAYVVIGMLLIIAVWAITLGSPAT